MYNAYRLAVAPTGSISYVNEATAIVHFWHGGILNLLYLYTIPFFVVGLFTIGLSRSVIR